MSDSFKEVGKGLYKNRRDSDYATKRLANRPPRVEKSSDVFDALTPFILEFKTRGEDGSVKLDLTFKVPPPTGCCAGCFCSACEVFDNIAVITVKYPYIAGSVVMIVDGEISENFTEFSPSTGTITRNSGGTIIRICYIYLLEGC